MTQFCWIITATIIIYLSRYSLKIFKFIYCVYTCMHPYTYVSIREHLQSLFCPSTMWVQVKPTIRLGCNGLHSLSHLVGPPYDFFFFFTISLFGKTLKKSVKLAFLFQYPNYCKYFLKAQCSCLYYISYRSQLKSILNKGNVCSHYSIL